MFILFSVYYFLRILIKKIGLGTVRIRFGDKFGGRTAKLIIFLKYCFGIRHTFKKDI